MRVQLALNVTDLEAAIEFYGKLFDAKPAKVKHGYANFAIDQPPLKLVLIEGEGAGGSVNHLGVEVEERGDVRAATARFTESGLATFEEQGVCCYADQDKVWVTGPDGERWEVYTVLGDADQMHAEGACCAPSGEKELASACC
jgi:catechol 2,3-dioxygenase-like lactoylglutathione lyase family enzyme